MLSLHRTTCLLTMAAICAIWPVATLTRADAPKTSVPMMSMGGMDSAKAADTAQPTITDDGKAETTLTMDVRRYDFEGTKTYNRMYMPTGAILSPNKPAGITKEPHYNGTPKYATITIGNGTPNHFTIVDDEAEGHEPKIYIDLNGDGDLTNDGDGDWQIKQASTNGGEPSYMGTWTFTPGWKSADGTNTV